MKSMDLSLADVIDAAWQIRPWVRTTPVIDSPWLSAQARARVFLKLENLQVTGSFKVRGALAKCLRLTAAERERGVVAASAGNHAQGVAFAAAQLHLSALIVVPLGTPEVKVAGIRRWGADLQMVGATYDDSEAFAVDVARATGRVLVHAFEDPAVVAGQGTVALETLWQDPAWDAVVVPVGGGGLMGGVGTVVKSIRPDTQVIGVQSEASPPWYYSFQAGQVVSTAYGPTLAEGLSGRIGDVTFGLVRRVVDEMALVEEEAIAAAMVGLAREHRVIVEGSGAVGVAALLSGRITLEPGARVLVIVSGGNVDLPRLAELLAGGSPR